MYIKLTAEEKARRAKERREKRELEKDMQRMKAEQEQPEVDKITITIEWKKSYMWGSNPHATAEIKFKKPCSEYGGTFKQVDGYTCSGCGYDKESTVIAEIFNDFLKYKLWQKSDDQLIRKDHKWKEENGAPYGISNWKRDNSTETKYFSGGIGTNCYFAISEFIGGKFERVASGKTFDVYTYTDNN